MSENQNQPVQTVNAAQLGDLTRSELKQLETKEKTAMEKTLETVTLALPVACGIVALLEYLLLPNYARNYDPFTYVYVLCAFIAAYITSIP